MLGRQLAKFGMWMAKRNHIVIDGGNTTLNLELDGCALLCRRNDRNLARHPIRRLDRITLRGSVSVHTKLLASLSRNGIPVICIASDGLVETFIPPRCLARQNLGDILSDFLPDNLTEITNDWLRAEISRHAKALQIGDPAAAARSEWTAAELFFQAAFPHMKKKRATQVANEIGSFCRLLAVRALSDGGIPRRWLGCSVGADPDLTESFGLIAVWRLLRFAVAPRHRKTVRSALKLDRLQWGEQTARLAERSRDQIYSALRRDLHRYHLHLLDTRRSTLWRG